MKLGGICKEEFYTISSKNILNYLKNEDKRIINNIKDKINEAYLNFNK